MVLTNFPHDPILDLDPWVGQRSASYRFALTNGVTGEHLGDINPIRGASLTHDTSRTIKRNLRMSLGVVDQAAINPITDRVSVYMVFPDGTEYPLGRYMFTDDTRTKFTSGDLGQPVLTDEMFLVDQQITVGINGLGLNVSQVIQEVLSGLPITYLMESAPFACAEAWGIGQYRGSILESLSIIGDLFSPWFDNDGVLRFIRTFNPADQIPDFDFDDGNLVLRTGIVENDDLLTAPNTFIVISNAAQDSTQPVVGRASVPPSAPNSVVNRGFEIAQVEDLQISDSAQAQAVAEGLVNRQTIFERVTLATAPDPRFDGYNVVHWQSDLWLSLAWSLNLVEGSPMSHLMRRAYRG
jgi:hypothetical protein